MRCCALLCLLSTAAPAQPQPYAPARVQVRPQEVLGPVSPLLYGQFAEFMFEDIKGGLHAELVVDRGFEEQPNVHHLPRNWDRYPDERNDDDRLRFGWDDKVFYGDKHSLRIELKGDEDGYPRGIRQSRLPVRAGIPYHGYLWARGTEFKGRLRVGLEADQTDGPSYAQADLGPVSGDWKQYRFTLQPTQTDPLAKLAIRVEGTGKLWVDQVSLLPGDAVDGVRADVFQKIKALRPAFIRWPGGNVAQDYWWTWGVGPRDRRQTWSNLSWRNEPEPGDFGTDEYLKLCENVGATPTLTVNVEGRGATAELAAQWVEYCNGPVTSKFGAMRAANGHPEPYNVKIWEIGNEIWGNWVRGHSDAATYGRNFNKYVEAMKKVDPTLRFIAVGDNDMRWNNTVLQLIGDRADWLAVHHYYFLHEIAGDPANLMARPLYYERFYQQLAKKLPQRTKLAINEWNTTFVPPRQHTMESGLYAARMLNVFLRSRGLVEMEAVSDLVNGWSGGVIQASRHGLFVTPTYHVNAMYAGARPRQLIATEVVSPTFDSSKEGKAVPVLDAVATRSEDGQLHLHAVNTSPTQTLELTVDGARVKDWSLLTAPPGVSNTFAKPHAVEVQGQRVPAGTLLLPPHSVSVFTLAP